MPEDQETSERSQLRLAFLGDPRSVHLHRWLNAFVARGHAVCLLLADGADAPAGALPGVERLSFRSLKGRPSLSGAWNTRRDLRRLFARWRPDVLHAHYARSPAWHAWLSGWRPYAVTVWGSDVLRADAMTRIGRVATRISLRQAALVTAGTRRLAEAALEFGAHAERIQEAQFGIDTTLFSPGPPPADLREALDIGDARVIVSPRILAPLYRHRVALEALATLPDDVVMLSSSMLEEPAERAALEADARRLGVADRWRILPPMDAMRMAELYRLADVVVSVPESDAMPQSVMEAMATGTAAVISDLPDARDWLADLTPELMVPVGDAAATATALRRALNRPPAEREALGRRLRERVVERADATRSMDRVEELYRALIGARA